MSSSPQTPEALLRRLEWTVLRRLDGLLHGSYRTLFRGQGLDLADLRAYQLHDDVRHIDWNVTARLQEPFVRQYNEDRDVTGWFLLDLSPSVDFGSGTTKRHILGQFVTVLTRVLTRHGNPVGAIFYSDGVDLVIPPRTGRRHVLYMLDSMMNRPARAQTGPTDLGDLLQAAANVVTRRALVFVVSDFISTPGWGRPLAHLARRHETIAVRLSDPAERELPQIGLAMVQDAETGEQIFVDTEDRGIRKRFALAAERRETEIRTAFTRAGVDALELWTDDDLMDALLRFAELRRRRVLTATNLPPHLEVVAP
jgi:uncharacterized protein (DUF58 family)